MSSSNEHVTPTEPNGSPSAAPPLRPLRLPVEVALGTDLADLAAIAAGAAGPELPASVHDSGLRWATAGTAACVTADPPPSGRPGLRRPAALGTGPATGRHGSRGAAGAAREAQARCGPQDTPPPAPSPPRGRRATIPGWPRCCTRPSPTSRHSSCATPHTLSDTYLAAGVPWRCGMAPAEALAAARMTLPLGTRLAAGTLRTLARTQLQGQGPRTGMIPGPPTRRGPAPPAGLHRNGGHTALSPPCSPKPAAGGCPSRRPRNCCPRPSAA